MNEQEIEDIIVAIVLAVNENTIFFCLLSLFCSKEEKKKKEIVRSSVFVATVSVE